MTAGTLTSTRLRSASAGLRRGEGLRRRVRGGLRRAMGRAAGRSRGITAPGTAGGCWQNDMPEPTLGLPADEAEALLPQRLLQGGEIVVLILKPSLWFILLSRLGWLATVAAIAAGLIWLEHRYGLGWYELQDVATLGMGAITAVLLWQTLDWFSRVFVLTDRRVVRQMGVLRPQLFEAPLHRSQHTELLLTIRERLFGLGTIGFATAGTGIPEAYWVMLNSPHEVHHRVVRTINRYRRGGEG